MAFYACLYFAGLRPEEAAFLNKRHLALSPEGWGELHLDGAEPYAGREWTDSGRSRDRRQLKQRKRDESRTAPCPPELTALIDAHLAEFGTGPDGRCCGWSEVVPPAGFEPALPPPEGSISPPSYGSLTC